MKTKQILTSLLCLMLVCSLLMGCGASSKSYAMQDMAAAEAAAEEPRSANGATLTESGSHGSTALPESRKWIITVQMSAETEDLDALTASLDETIKALEGYVEDQNIYNGSAYANRRYRSANLTVRIPADQVDQFTQEVEGIANVVRKEKNLEDVTLNYVATESRINALETEEARLLELLAKAETMADLLEIEARLTDVRYELESHASRLRLYDNQIDYATIHLNIEEVQEYTPVEEPTLWERISSGFGNSLKALGESLVDLLVMVIIASPFLVVYGGAAAAVILLVRRLGKVRKQKKAAKQARNLQKEQKSE